MTPVVKQILHYGNRKIEYDVIKSRRVKTSEIIVDENKIVIRTPSNKPQSEIDRMMGKKARWIIDKQKEYKEYQKQITKPTFRLDSTLPYLGKNYSMVVDENYRGDPSIKFQRGKFVFSFPSNEWSLNQIKTLYESWLDQEAQIVFSKKVSSYSKELKLEVQKIVVKNMRNRWGSVTKKGVLNLNVNLLKTPSKIIDYIIIHELCHFRIRDHSYRFWELLRKIMPSYEEYIIWLEKHATSLIEG